MATGYSCFFLTSLEAARPCVLGLAHGRGRAGDQRSCSSVLRRPAATASWIWAAPIHAWHSAPTWRASSSSSTCGGAQGRALQLGLALHGCQQRPGVPAPCLPGRRAPARRHRLARWWDRRPRAELGAVLLGPSAAASSASQWTAPTGCCGWAWADSGSKYQLQQLVGHCESLTFWPHLTD